jgi:hypothetical protein
MADNNQVQEALDDAPQAPIVSTYNAQELDNIGVRLFAKFDTYKMDRKPLEEQWLKNLRQFRGIYDPEIEGAIPKDRSRAYPKITRKKVINTVSRLMEMLFPQTEKNWGIKPTPMPDLAVADMQRLLDEIGMPVDGQPLNLQQLDAAVMKIAEARCKMMGEVIDDQLSEIDWVTLARKVIFSGVLYGPGIAKGPLVKLKKQSTVVVENGRYVAKEVSRRYPFFEFLSVWSYYPDLSAKDRASRDDFYERHVLSRQQIEKLKDRDDFMQDRVTAYLASKTTGDYKEEWWESLLRVSGDRQTGKVDVRKYLGLEYWGFCSGHELAAAGIQLAPNQPFPADRLAEQFHCTAFLLGNMLVKLKVNPYRSQRLPDHIFVYEDDDINLMGSGLPPIVRDSQMAICEAARMSLDNGSAVCGPILEMNVDLLMPGQDLAIHAYKTFFREDEDRAGVPAVREIKVDSHIAELQGLIELFMAFADDETALPPTSTGDITKGGSEAVRTQGNMSMIMSAAALPIRDTVRNFDTFTESVVSSLVDWNMQFNPRDDIKGDFVTIARGTTSLIAKEVRAIALDNFKATLTPDEVPYVKTGELLKERAKSRDIPDSVFEDDATVKKKLDAQAQVAQNQQQQQSAMIEAQVKKTLTEALKNLASAKRDDSGAQSDIFEVIMKAVTDANKSHTASSAAA